MRWRPPGGATGERRYRRKAFRSAKGGTTKSPPNDRKYSARWRWHSLPRNRTGRCTRPSSGARRWTGSAPSGRGWLPGGLTDAPWPGSSPGGPPVGMRTSSGISRFEAVERVRRAAQQMLARLQGLRADGLGEGGQGRLPPPPPCLSGGPVLTQPADLGEQMGIPRRGGREGGARRPHVIDGQAQVGKLFHNRRRKARTYIQCEPAPLQFGEPWRQFARECIADPAEFGMAAILVQRVAHPRIGQIGPAHHGANEIEIGRAHV